MGNRAVIINKKDMLENGEINPNQLGIYLHWNGGKDSVEAFLKYCELHGYDTPDNHGWLCLGTVISSFLGVGCSAEINIASHMDLDNYDNGVYIIDGWKIVGRKYLHNKEQHYHNLKDMLESINEKMPVEDKIDSEFFKAKFIARTNIKVGDYVFKFNTLHKLWEKCCVVGFGDGWVNGYDVTGIPFVDKYNKEDGKMAENINNYLLTEWVYRKK